MRPPFIDLLALPCAGASATRYLRWCRLLPQWIRVVPVGAWRLDAPPGYAAALAWTATATTSQLR